MSSVVLVIYGIFLIAGGLMGFKKGSKVSLIAGLISGILIFAGVWITSVSPKPGWIFLTCVNALLTLSFTSRLLKTRKFMPSGMLLIITLAVLIFCITKLV